MTQLRYFAVVAETGNLTAAAEILGISQPALSAAMSTLEESIGVQLLVRERTRGVRITPNGRQFAGQLKHLLEEADSLYEMASGLATELRGVLRIGVFAPLAPFRLPAILRMFEAAHPGVDVEVLEGDLAGLQVALRAGQCDVALMYAHGLGPEFAHTLLERVPPHVEVHPGHPAAARPEREITLADLADEPSIVLDLPHTREYYTRLYAIAGITPRVRYRFTGYETVRSFVAKGHGYAMLNQRVHTDMTYSGGRVVVLNLTDTFPAIDVVLAHPPGVRPTRRVEAFEQLCRRIYGAPGLAP